MRGRSLEVSSAAFVGVVRCSCPCSRSPVLHSWLRVRHSWLRAASRLQPPCCRGNTLRRGRRARGRRLLEGHRAPGSGHRRSQGPGSQGREEKGARACGNGMAAGIEMDTGLLLSGENKKARWMAGCSHTFLLFTQGSGRKAEKQDKSEGGTVRRSWRQLGAGNRELGWGCETGTGKRRLGSGGRKRVAGRL